MTLPDFTRVAWASAEARDIWMPRVSDIARAWLDVEVESVVRRIRPSALQVWPDDRLQAVEALLRARGLAVVRLQQTARPTNYSSSSRPGTGAWRVAVTREPLVEAWREAWLEGNDDAIGALLGFPACCRAFFARTWGAGLVDGTLQMAGTPGENVACNILGRWLGVRLVPHLPCSWECAPTVALASQMQACWLGEAWPHAVQFLTMAAEYSALHGAAEIKWPVVKVIARTDYTSEKRIVRVPGERDVPGAPRGHGAVAPVPQVIPVSSLRTFKASVEAADPRTWGDNGFASLEAMQEAHVHIVEMVRLACGDIGRVLDLGSGNGMLVRQLGRLPHGCEVDKERAARAVVPTLACNLAEYPLGTEDWDLIAVMPGRLLELQADVAAALVARLREATPRLLVYAYGDWLARYCDLRGLAEAAGLRWRPVAENAVAALLEGF